MNATPQTGGNEADADTVASRAAQVIATMGADIRALTSERDRYRAAWQSARQRAEAYGEGILRLVDDRETYQRWLKEAEVAVTSLRRMADEAQQSDDDGPTWSDTCPYCKRWYTTSEPGAHEEACPMRPPVEARQTDTETQDACTCGSAGDAFVPAGHYTDCPAAAPEPHPTETDVAHAMAVLDRFQGRTAAAGGAGGLTSSPP